RRTPPRLRQLRRDGAAVGRRWRQVRVDDRGPYGCRVVCRLRAGWTNPRHRRIRSYRPCLVPRPRTRDIEGDPSSAGGRAHGSYRAGVLQWALPCHERREWDPPVVGPDSWGDRRNPATAGRRRDPGGGLFGGWPHPGPGRTRRGRRIVRDGDGPTDRRAVGVLRRVQQHKVLADDRLSRRG